MNYEFVGAALVAALIKLLGILFCWGFTKIIDGRCPSLTYCALSGLGTQYCKIPFD